MDTLIRGAVRKKENITQLSLSDRRFQMLCHSVGYYSATGWLDRMATAETATTTAQSSGPNEIYGPEH